MELSLSLNFPVKASFLPKQTQIRDSEHWNSAIKHQAKLKNDRAILSTYTEMKSLGISPDNATLPLVLKACVRLQAVDQVKKIHSDVMNTDLIDDVRVQTGLIDSYCKCGCVVDARHLFDEMTERDLVSWNAMISGCVACSEYKEAILLFRKMQMENLEPNSTTLVGLIRACEELLEWRLGREIHGYCLRNELFYLNAHVGTALMGFYMRFNMRTAYLVFDLMALKTIASWNAMITGCLNTGNYLESFEIFVQMIVDGIGCDSITMILVIQACEECSFLKFGVQVHQMVIKLGLDKGKYIINALINMYSKNGRLNSSCDLFGSITTKDVALWNSLIFAHVKSGFHEEAMNMFVKMRLEGIEQDERTMAIILPICEGLSNGLKIGKSLHGHMIKSGLKMNTCLGNALLSMYSELNSAEDALKVFGKIRNSDLISWNTVILALGRHKMIDQAWELFMQMRELDVKPNSHTIISLLTICENEAFLCIGKSIHGYTIKHGIKIDPSLNTALTEMYMKCSDEATAISLFEGFHDRDVISWNSLIVSYVRNNQAHKALLIFNRLISEVEPNTVSIINVLSSCSQLAYLPQGQCIHAYAKRRESLLGFDLSLANALITMYARCGNMHYAEKIFKYLPKRNVVSWNAMIDGYGMHGRGHDAMHIFSKMQEDGFEPNEITFVSALSACSHSGLIKEGLSLFGSMIHEFCITPELIHYGCIVDLLGRGGHLDEAMEFIDIMPMVPDASVWRAVLGACRVHSNTKLAKNVFKNLVKLEPDNAGNYVLLSNIYAASGIWSEVQKLRKLIEDKSLQKPPGKSWIVVRCEVHSFNAGDKSHPRSDQIYEKLRSLSCLIKENGYVPDLSWVLHDEDDEEKARRLLGHSEKLAIAFGLISVKGGAPILISKNLRVCGDCHEFAKHVSNLVQREIVLRDGSRFHHFSNGFCSCKDYW